MTTDNELFARFLSVTWAVAVMLSVAWFVVRDPEDRRGIVVMAATALTIAVSLALICLIYRAILAALGGAP